MSDRERPPGAANERPTATAIAAGPELFDNTTETKHSAETDDDQELSYGFEWTDDNTVLHEQPRTACYWNPNSQVVIRQAGHYPDDDAFVFFDPEKLPDLIRALWEFVPSHLRNGAR